VDRVLPLAPYRQYVCTFPWQIHFLLSVDRQFMSRMLGAYLRTLFAWQRRRGRQLGIRDGQTGAITFIQRFNSALSLFPHLHSIVPDGLFVDRGGNRLEFAPLSPPCDEDIGNLTEKLAKRLGAIAVRRLEQAQQQPECVEDEQAAVHATIAEALRPPLRLPSRQQDVRSIHNDKPLCAKVGGFSLHAARTVEPHDRAGLERLCRYGLRAPFATDRFTLDPDGRVRYHLPKPWPGPNGKTELVLEPVALLRRLAALIPAPYGNLIRYHGVFANRSRYRALLPPPPVSCDEAEGHTPLSTSNNEPANSNQDFGPPPVDQPIRPRKLGWAQLLRRVLDVDGLTCPSCGAAMVVLALISDPPVVRRILDHLRLPTTPPPLTPSRLLQQQFDFEDEPPADTDYIDEPQDPAPQPCAARGPP
jgi:hypothetical protein